MTSAHLSNSKNPLRIEKTFFIAALILVGGASSRMGQDKALLLWRGVSLLQRVVRAVAQSCGEVYLLTPRTKIYQAHLQTYPPEYFLDHPQKSFLNYPQNTSPESPPKPLPTDLPLPPLSPLTSPYLPLPPSTSFPNYHWLPEPIPHQGPLVALSQGLGKIPAEWVLVLACDMPLLDGRILQEWRSRLSSLPDSTLALVPYNGYWHPLCGFYRPQALPALEEFLAQGGKSFQAWLDRLPAQKIPLSPRELNMLWNCNSPEDMRAT